MSCSFARQSRDELQFEQRPSGGRCRHLRVSVDQRSPPPAPNRRSPGCIYCTTLPPPSVPLHTFRLERTSVLLRTTLLVPSQGFSVIAESYSVRFSMVISEDGANSVRAAMRTSRPVTVPSTAAFVTLWQFSIR